MEKIKCIYLITSPTNKKYVGMTTNYNKRMNYYSNGNCEKQRMIYASIMKYGWEKHSVDILCECDGVNETQLRMLEFHYYMYYLNSGYKMLNLRTPFYDTHHIESINRIKIGNSGRKISDEMKLRISKTLKAKYKSGEIKNYWEDKKFSEEHKQKLRDAKIGYKQSDIHIKNRVETIKELRKTKPYIFSENGKQLNSLKRKDRFMGVEHPNSKLNDDEVKEIWYLLNNSKLTQIEIGKMFSVSRSAIKGIKNGTTWTHITGLERKFKYYQDRIDK